MSIDIGNAVAMSIELALASVGTWTTVHAAKDYVQSGTAAKHVQHVRDELTLRTAQLKARCARAS